MLVNLFPSTLCNFRCDFCYIDPEDLKDPHKLDLMKLKEMLDEFSPITHIDIYGGEPSLLADDYALMMLDICAPYASVNVISNGFRIPWWMKLPTVWPTFSWDYDCRERWEKVYENLMEFDKPFSLLMVATQELISRPVDKIVDALNKLPNLSTFEIKPYAPNEFNAYKVSNVEFEEFVKKFILIKDKPIFINEQLVENVVSGAGVRENIIEPSVFFYPDGTFGTFVQVKGIEQFVSFDERITLDAYYQHKTGKIRDNKYCSGCNYLYSCISENFREVKDLSDSCDGFRNLINWYANDRTNKALG